MVACATSNNLIVSTSDHGMIQVRASVRAITCISRWRWESSCAAMLLTVALSRWFRLSACARLLPYARPRGGRCGLCPKSRTASCSNRSKLSTTTPPSLRPPLWGDTAIPIPHSIALNAHVDIIHLCVAQHVAYVQNCYWCHLHS